MRRCKIVSAVDNVAVFLFISQRLRQVVSGNFPFLFRLDVGGFTFVMGYFGKYSQVCFRRLSPINNSNRAQGGMLFKGCRRTQIKLVVV